MKKTIGILGGMGPLATADLFKKIVEVTDASCDREHVRVCIDSNTEIPDRTAAILSDGKSPLPEMIKTAVRLEGMGADVIIMPCNTSHYFLPQLRQCVDVPFLSMLEETAREAQKRGIKKAGLMATDGTVRSGIYHEAFQAHGIELVVPDARGQTGVMNMIYRGVKAGNYHINLDDFQYAIDDLFAKGAEVLVLGCTELPLAFEMFQIDQPNLDPTLCIAAAAVRYVGGKVKGD